MNKNRGVGLCHMFKSFLHFAPCLLALFLYSVYVYAVGPAPIFRWVQETSWLQLQQPTARHSLATCHEKRGCPSADGLASLSQRISKGSK